MAKIIIFFVVLWVLFGIPLLGAMMRKNTAATAAVNGMHTAATFADGDEARPHQLAGHLRRSTSPEAQLDRDEARRDREEARRELEHAHRDREEARALLLGARSDHSKHSKHSEHSEHSVDSPDLSDATANGGRRRRPTTSSPAVSIPSKPRIWAGADAEHLHGVLGRALNPDGTVPSPQSHAPPDWAPVPIKAGGLSAAERREAHKGYCFNSLVCGALPLDRSAPDTRPQGCPRQYPEAAMRATGPASVVFVFYNEALCALLRSVHSVLNRTPPHLLKEIVLVDDWSNKTTHPWLGDRLARHLRTLPKVKLVRLPERGGLMTARTRGAEAASGKVIVFLDSHIEATKGWIEPLLSRIATHPKTFVVPRIAGIDAETFRHDGGSSGGLSVLGFHWRLGQTSGFRPEPSGKAALEPQASPIMAGGLLAARRDWFFELGAYDPEMRLYGGEEMEIAWRIWQCGGRVEYVPCSVVGHVFRSSQ
jgi:GT2 family glycosyltransferase